MMMNRRSFSDRTILGKEVMKNDLSSSYDDVHLCKRPKYDVFVNYSLEDTGNKFVSHLKAALKRNIFTISDHNTLPIGQDMRSELLKAIEESHTYLVVFSTNYSPSVESLDELVLIMDSLLNFKNRKVIPVFLNVDPSDVRNIKGCFEEAFRAHEANIDPKRVHQWRKALKEAGQRSGHPLKNGDDEAAFIQNIIQDLKKIKIPLELFDAQHAVGIEPRAQAIISALRLGDLDFHNIVAVFGISGSGKTTIVQAVFDRIVAEFDYYCFIKNIHFYKNKGPFWEVELLREVLRGLTGNDPTHENVGAPEIRRLLESEKTLLVLDDVEKVDDLKALGRFTFCLIKFRIWKQQSNCDNKK
ncbi:TMV resistance protein N-like isoform X2 [Rutidosis leptorrhynchoides]|uniref:TMV resistance protein N-like isoform X2 n=1 Tax=Rutidosis leptorrhynchoides TaxID=125765 RepID=UPI003A99A88B